MLDQLTAAWRARRVLLIGGPDAQNLCMQELLLALGARPARIPDACKPHTLNRAMTTGRVSAVIVPSMHTLGAPGDLFSRLHALKTLLDEMREAGIPLCILCSQEDVFAPGLSAAEETSPLGGKTQEGLIASLLQLYADGASRALLGDAVPTILCRHVPCLGSDHPSVYQYSRWCRALLRGRRATVEHPSAQGTFFHPLDAALGALCLGARYFSGDTACTGAFHLPPSSENRCANRSAYLALAAMENSTRAPQETHPPCDAPFPLLRGDKIKKLCGYSPMLNARQALALLMEYERARAIGESAAQIKRAEQAEIFLKSLC